MRKLSFSRSKHKAEKTKAEGDALPASPLSKSSSIKKLPGKLAKGVKRQLWKLDEVLHHVTHTTHRSRSSSDTWDVKYVKEVDLQSIERASLSSPALSVLPLPPSTADSGLSTLTMTEEHRQDHKPPIEEVSSNSESIFTNPPPTVYVEAETPDPFLVDEEGDALSEDGDSSAAASQLTVSPAHDVPLDLPPPSSPEPQRQVPTSPLPNLNKEVPPPPSSESDQEEVPDIYVPTLIVPTMFLPIPNVRLPLFTNPLTWWLCRSSMYTTCIRPIR